MKGKRKTPKVASKRRALAKDAGVSFSTIQRIVDQHVGASLDNIESIAAALHVSVYQLLIPDLQAADPQAVAGANMAEQRMYRHWRQRKTGGDSAALS